jgi:hypothetical protein
VRLLYLELFARIQLTHARLRRSGTERHRRVYERLRAAVASERLVVRLSSMQYMELLNVTDPAQRARGRPHDG